MNFDNLMYNGKEIKVIVDLDECFIECNDNQLDDDCDTLDLSNITDDVDRSMEG